MTIVKSANLIGFLNRLAKWRNSTDSQPLDINTYQKIHGGKTKEITCVIVALLCCRPIQDCFVWRSIHTNVCQSTLQMWLKNTVVRGGMRCRPICSQFLTTLTQTWYKVSSIPYINKLCYISKCIEVYERSRASVKQSLRIYSHHTKVEAIAKISNNKQKYQEINDKYQGKTCFRCHFR